MLRITRLMRRLAAVSTAHAASAAVLVGSLLVAYGLSLYSLPLGPIAFGLALIAFVALDSEQLQRKG
jgi:hypothetical protein